MNTIRTLRRRSLPDQRSLFRVSGWPAMDRLLDDRFEKVVSVLSPIGSLGVFAERIGLLLLGLAYRSVFRRLAFLEKHTFPANKE